MYLMFRLLHVVILHLRIDLGIDQLVGELGLLIIRVVHLLFLDWLDKFYLRCVLLLII